MPHTAPQANVDPTKTASLVPTKLLLAFTGLLLVFACPVPATAEIDVSSVLEGFDEIVVDWQAARTSANNASRYAGANGRAKIQAAIDDRAGDDPVTVYVPASGPDEHAVWLLDRALVLPSNTILLLDGATLLLKENANDNLVRNANPFDGGNSNIRVIGRAGARLHGNAGKQDHKVWGYRNENSYRYFGIYLCKVDGFEISNLKIGPTSAWAIAPQACGNGLVQNIEFAQDGKSTNQDGVTSGRGLYNTVIRNLTGVTHDDTIDVSSTDQSKFAHPGKELVTDCYNVWIDNVVTDAGGKKVVKLVAGNGRKVHNIHVSNVKALGRGWAIEIEGDWASVKPTADEMHHLSFDRIEGRSDGLIVITSDCRDVSFKNMAASSGYRRILEQRAGYQAIRLTIDGVSVNAPHDKGGGELFYFAGKKNQNITIKNVQATFPIKTLLRATGSMTALAVDNVTIRDTTDTLFVSAPSSSIKGVARNISLPDKYDPTRIVKDMPDLVVELDH